MSFWPRKFQITLPFSALSFASSGVRSPLAVVYRHGVERGREPVVAKGGRGEHEHADGPAGKQGAGEQHTLRV